MTISVKIEHVGGVEYAVQVSRESHSGQVGELLGYVQPGANSTFHYWSENKLVLTEVPAQKND